MHIKQLSQAKRTVVLTDIDVVRDVVPPVVIGDPENIDKSDDAFPSSLDR